MNASRFLAQSRQSPSFQAGVEVFCRFGVHEVTETLTDKNGVHWMTFRFQAGLVSMTSKPWTPHGVSSFI